MRAAVALALVIVLAGCAGTDWSRHLYEGIRQRQEATADPNSKHVAQPDYDHYQREREALKEGKEAAR